MRLRNIARTTLFGIQHGLEAGPNGFVDHQSTQCKTWKWFWGSKPTRRLARISSIRHLPWTNAFDGSHFLASFSPHRLYVYSSLFRARWVSRCTSVCGPGFLALLRLACLLCPVLRSLMLSTPCCRTLYEPMTHFHDTQLH